MTNWPLLLNKEARRPRSAAGAVRSEGRREFERDFDRILFSTPVRRMADKTQVFPLEAHDAIHTRLTHSHEVSALARGVGLDLVARFGDRVGIPIDTDHLRDVSALMAAVGLVHDIGNPPFGHQGEHAIRRWFTENETRVFDRRCGVNAAMRQDFLKFEGNAQTFRLVTRLQLVGDEFGLNLTYGALAALLKYTVPSHKASSKAAIAGRHKPGFFYSERDIVEEVWAKTGLPQEQRHPLTYLVEACDDIAYSTIDVEDTVKKDLASYADVCAHLQDSERSGDSTAAVELIKNVIEYSTKKRQDVIANTAAGRSHSPAELDDLSMQLFRVATISAMVRAALDAFVENFPQISVGQFSGDLLEASDASRLRRLLKDFLAQVAFPHRSVLEIELRGSLVISALMDRLWEAITGREDRASAAAKRLNPMSAYTYSRISENYRRVFENSTPTLPMRYREAQLLTDMVSGMTDSFALSLLKDLRRFDR
jgi:dGTPase